MPDAEVGQAEAGSCGVVPSALTSPVMYGSKRDVAADVAAEERAHRRQAGLLLVAHQRRVAGARASSRVYAPPLRRMLFGWLTAQAASVPPASSPVDEPDGVEPVVVAAEQ